MDKAQQYLSQNFLGVVIFLQVAMYVSLFFNFPLVREVVGAFYLTFIPGYLFVKLFKLELDSLEFILYSVGFSVAFLILSGLVLNEFGPLIGFSFPLSTLPLSLAINTLVLIGAAVAYLRGGKEAQVEDTKKQPFSLSYIILALIPLLSVAGTYLVNTTANNSLLLLMIVSIVLLFTAVAFNRKSTNIYPFAILMIAIALLLQTSLISNYILPYGSDSPNELYLATTTQLAGRWNPVFPIVGDLTLGRFNAMLSITILPTVYSNLLGISLTWVYKLVYPLIFALVPVGLYLLWKPYIGKKFAFFATFLFMADITFFTELTALNRQMIGELFFVLLLLLLLNKKIKQQAKFVSFGVLSVALILSHYALAEIFLFLIFAAWLVSMYLKRPSLNLQSGMVLFFFVMMCAWYIYTSGSVVFTSFTTYATIIAAQFGGIFTPASRGAEVLSGLGLTQSPSMLNTVSRAFAYLTEFFIAIGAIALFFNKTRFHFEREFAIFSACALAFLAALIIVPGLADAMNMTRFYHILLIFLAPLCIVGMWSSVNFVFKHQRKILFSLLIAVVLVSYFLFQTNFVYEVAKTESWSIPLSGYRMSPLILYGEYGYINSNGVYCSQWISNNINYQNSTLFADAGLDTSLIAYGHVYTGYIDALTNTTVLTPGQFVGLSSLSVDYQQLTWNNTLPAVLQQTDLIYSNGGSQVYTSPG